MGVNLRAGGTQEKKNQAILIFIIFKRNQHFNIQVDRNNSMLLLDLGNVFNITMSKVQRALYLFTYLILSNEKDILSSLYRCGN